MHSYRDFQDDFYHPKMLFGIAFQIGKEVAHGIPVPDQLGWLVSFPFAFMPMFLIALAYANGYYVSMGSLWAGERIAVQLERLWRRRLVEHWREYVPEAYREQVEAVVPDVNWEEKMTQEEQERRQKEIEEMREKRGTGQKNVTKDSDQGISFRNK